MGLENARVIPIDGTEIIALQISHLTPELKQQYNVIDNSRADLSGWDSEALAEMLANGIALSQGFTDLELKVLIEETLSPLAAEVERDEREALQRETGCPACGHVF